MPYGLSTDLYSTYARMTPFQLGLTNTDREKLECIRRMMPAIALAFGTNCMVTLHSAETPELPCIAVENGFINNLKIGDPAAGFVRDTMLEEGKRGGKDTIGVYYTRTVHDHAIKCVISVIRNERNDPIGCLCIGIDVAVPLNEFLQSFTPDADNDLANSLSDPSSLIGNIDQMVEHAISQAVAVVNERKGLSATDRNRSIVQILHDNGIFSVRGAVGVVATALGVTRYTIYNYLKDVTTP